MMNLDSSWFFYIVQCRDRSYYFGITNNVDHRVKAHNRCVGAKYTAGRRPVKLVYCELQENASQAAKRETQVKGWTRAKKELLITGFPRSGSNN